MDTNRLPFLPLAIGIVTILAGLSAPHRVMAAQGEGDLAQAPLNLGTQVPPAFIMALDDSGSMRFQTLFPARDGTALWNRDGTTQPYSFFHSTGALAGRIRGTDPATAGREFVHVAPYPAPRQAAQTNDNAAIPPIDTFGFSRSHVYNPSYFDPNLEYVRWRNPDGSYWPNAVPTAVRVDPNNAAPTVNMTVERAVTTNALATDHRFRVRNGMVLPAGTKVNGTPCQVTNSNSTASTPSGWRVLNANVTFTQDCDVYIAYFPATFYLPAATPAPAGFVLANRVLVQNACTYPTATGAARCDMYRYEIRPANYSSTAAYDAAILNFSNWFQYYGARNRAIVAGITNSLVDITNMRVGYFTINNRVNVTMRDMASPAAKQTFYNDIVTLQASGNTPNLQSVDHLGQQFQRTGAGAPIQYACQKNGGMLFTDGLSNVAGPNVGNRDGGLGVPFADTHSNTLADIATRYYLDATPGVSPLNTTFTAGRVPIPNACNTLPVDSLERKRLDCQPNLHMNFFGVTLGARGVTFDPDVDRDPFVAPHPAWPPFQSGERSTIDDIWHATVNTRGEFINARTPEEITTAMRRVLAAVAAGAGPSGSLALTGARVGDTSLSVVPEYASENNGTDWYGRLRAEKVEVDGAGVVSFTELWEASQQLPVAAARNIHFARPATTVSPTVAPFLTANVTPLSLLCSGPLSRCSAAEILGLGVTADQAISFLRGNPALEGTFLRDRTTLLGDIINSSPVISSPKDNYGYRSLYGANPADIDPYGYVAYMTAKAARPTVVYAGANDGMLHAFNAETGQEVFGYIPSMVLGHVGNLLFPYNAADGNDQKFQHRYYVDGPITVSDARWGASWNTVLVGSAGAGGKGVFALNVSNPTSFTGSNVLWEVTGSVTGNTGQRIGHVLGKPVVVPTRSGTDQPVWRAVFGNGYGSTSGNASLFIVDVATGAVATIEAIESGGPGTPNGLGSVVLVDRYMGTTDTRGSDGYADTAYGGDLHGNIWKFDLRNNTVANGGQPIFTASIAGQRQPITGGLEVASGPGGGVLLYFGTGSYAFANDATDQSLQSLYSVLDTGSSTPSTATRANLAQQQLVAGTDGLRNLSGAAVNYVTQRGWYLDLATVLGGDVTLRGERFVGNPRLQSGLILFPTFEPAGAANDPCAAGGVNWLYALNAISGAAGLSGLREGSPTGTAAPAGTVGTQLDTSGNIPVKDVAVLLPPPPGAVASDATAAEIAEALGRTCDLVISVAGAPPLYLPRACGRQSWRQVR